MSWPEHPPQRLLCAVDGSPTSDQAAEASVRMAARHGAEVAFAHVIDDERVRELAALVDEAGEVSRARLERRGDRILSRMGDLAARHGVVWSTHMEAGDPPRVLDRLAGEVEADMIVVGKVGLRGVRSWFVGSVTRRLIETCRIPVVVIPVR